MKNLIEEFNWIMEEYSKDSSLKGNLIAWDRFIKLWEKVKKSLKGE